MIVKNVIQAASEIAQNPRAGAAVAAATTTAGSVLDYFPEKDLAKIATLLGIVLTSMLIVIHGVKLFGIIRNGFKSDDTEDDEA